MLDECWDNAIVVGMDEKFNGLEGHIMRSVDGFAGVVESSLP
jgi:hypothetical protein